MSDSGAEVIVQKQKQKMVNPQDYFIDREQDLDISPTLSNYYLNAN